MSDRVFRVLSSAAIEEPIRDALAGRRVAIVCLHADPFDPAGIREGGGTHSYLREIISFCSSMGIHYIVMTRWANSELPELQELPEGKLIRLRIGPIAPVDKRLLNNFHNLSVEVIHAAVSRTLCVPDVIHSLYWNSGRASMDLSKRWRCRFVHSVISNGWRRIQSGFTDQPACRLAVEREVFQKAHQILCVSHEECQDLCEGYGVHPGKLLVVGRPVASRFIEPCRDGLGRPLSPLTDLIRRS